MTTGRVGSGPGATTARAGDPRRTLAILGILLVAANLRAAITVVGPLVGDVQTDLGLSSSEASILVALPVLMFAAFSPAVPRLVARIGMARTDVLALTVLAAGVLLRSVPWAPALWGGTLLLGAGIATLNVVLPAMVKRDFPQHTGRLTGWYAAVQALFAAFASGLAVPLAGLTTATWRLSFGVWAGLALVAAAVLLPRAVRDRPHRTPSDVRAGTTPGGTAGPWRSPWRSAVGWQLTAYMGLQSTFFYCVLTWWPSIERADGVSRLTAGAHQGVMLMVGIGMSVVAGRLVQRSRGGQQGPVLLFTCASLLAVVGQLLAPGLALAWVLLLGVGTSGSLVMALTMIGLRAGSHGQATALSGMVQGLGYALAAVGPFALGALYDATGAWTVPLVVLLVLKVPELVAAVLAARPRTIG